MDKLKFWKSDPKPAEAKPVVTEMVPEGKAPEVQPEINLKTPANDALGANNDALLAMLLLCLQCRSNWDQCLKPQ